MRIGIELNGVLRNTIGKFEQIYEKYLVEPQDFDSEDENLFKYEILSDVTSLNLRNHFSFKSDEELYDFLYNEHAMEIFGHSGSVELTSMNDINDFYLDNRDNHDILIVSDEVGKSKPASLFYLSKYGCMVETVKFYSELTINSLWDSIDVLLTANPKLLLNHPDDKLIIKYNTNYNQDIEIKHSISKLKELNNKIKELYDTSLG